jgi:hypothetical protein
MSLSIIRSPFCCCSSVASSYKDKEVDSEIIDPTLLSFNDIMACDPFSRASPLGRWATKEGHGDPSKRAFIMYYDYGMHIYGFFLVIVSPYRFIWA